MKEQEKQPSFTSELGEFMKPYKIKYAFSVIISIFGVASNMLSYVFISFIASSLFKPNISWEDIIINLILTIVFKLLYAVFINLSTHLSHIAAYSTLRDIRNALTDKMLRLPLGYFEEKGTGRLKTLIVDHVENMEKTLAHMLPELTANLLIPLCCTIWMMVIDYRLGLLAFAWIIFGLMATGGMMKDYNNKLNGQIKASKGMNQSVLEFVNGIEVIKNFGREGDVYEKYKDAVSGHAQYNVNWQKECQLYSALGMAISPFSLFPVILLGLYYFSVGSIAPETLFMLIILTFAIFGPIMNASSYFDQLAGVGVNAKEIKDVLVYPELKRGTLKSADNLNIEYQNVSFAYKENEEVLHNINLNIKEGEMVALVGPSGSGKSTIAKLLGGYWDPSYGDIKIGGHSINEFSQEYLNKLIAIVDQDTHLFDKSIKDNIRLACPNASDEEVIEASKKAGCHEFISKLPHGYDTQVGEDGNKLSGGEKQRIAIVRAMMKNAPIMIMDEATASTDPENEAEIQESLLAACKGKTLLVVAHRIYTIKNADKIVFVKDGKILASGTHNELLKTCKDYEILNNLSEGKLHD